MRRRFSHGNRIVLVFACLLVSLTAAAGSGKAATVAGRYDVGGSRLYLTCSGNASPTVVLDAGLGGDSSEWSSVQPALARVTRVCAWDRPGRGRSDRRPGQGEETTGEIVSDLHRLLRAASVPGPYVLVGHSIAGIDVRLYQMRYPNQIVGLVLDETDTENQYLFGTAVDQNKGERMLMRPGALELASSPHRLGRLPLAVIERGRDRETAWEANQAALSQLSGNVLLLLAKRSDHGVPFEQPGVITAATAAVVSAARTGSPLPHCTSAIRAADVQCLTPGTVPPGSTTISLAPWQLTLAGGLILFLGAGAGALLAGRVTRARSGRASWLSDSTRPTS